MSKAKSERQHPWSLVIVATAICAGLYAVGSYVTAYVPSPWGAGQFRPAVIIPAFFATLFGPFAGGLGAMIGTFIVDSAKHGYPYPGSFLAAIWGNFIGFYLFGWALRKRFSWGRFVAVSNITLVLANVVVAFLYVFTFKVLYLKDPSYVVMPIDVQIFFSIGLTIWWFVTMLPFVLLITPLLIRAAAHAVPSIVPEDVRSHSLNEELPKRTFAFAFLAPGLIMLLIGLATSFSGLGDFINTYFSDPAPTLIRLMFYASGGVLSVLGVLILSGQMFFWRDTSHKYEENEMIRQA